MILGSFFPKTFLFISENAQKFAWMKGYTMWTIVTNFEIDILLTFFKIFNFVHIFWNFCDFSYGRF